MGAPLPERGGARSGKREGQRMTASAHWGRRSILLKGATPLAAPPWLAACGGAGTTPAGGPPAATAGSLLFGAAISLTGSTAKEGGLTKEGYDIWRDVYNDAGGIKAGSKKYRIETKYYDDESNAQ